MKTTRTCSVEGCEAAHTARGFCKSHYYQAKRLAVRTGQEAPARPCDVDGCGNPHTAKGLCDKHYQRLSKLGTLELTGLPSLAERMRRYSKVMPTGCVEWQRRRDKDGYGMVALGDGSGRMERAARVAWELANRQQIPEGLHIDHLCRNRPCINPEHLEPVTPAENNRRMRVAVAAERAARKLSQRQGIR